MRGARDLLHPSPQRGEGGFEPTGRAEGAPDDKLSEKTGGVLFATTPPGRALSRASTHPLRGRDEKTHIAVSPPSTISVVPVIDDAAGLAK
jgi:hypothetical protein